MIKRIHIRKDKKAEMLRACLGLDTGESVNQWRCNHIAITPFTREFDLWGELVWSGLADRCHLQHDPCKVAYVVSERGKHYLQSFES